MPKEDLTLDKFVENKDENPKLISIFKKISLGNAPNAGEKRVFSNHYLSSQIRLLGTKYSHLIKEFQYTIPPLIEVNSNSSVFPEDEIKKALTLQWKNQCDGCEFNINEMVFPKVDNLNHVTKWYFHGVPEVPRGSFSVGVKVSENKSSITLDRVYWINGFARVLQKVPVLQRSLQYGDRVFENDIKWEFKDVTYSRGLALTPEKIIGQKVKMAKAPGQVLNESDLVREKAISRGELVKVFAKEGGLEVVTFAKAENEGHVGDFITLVNRTNKSRLTGVAVSPGEVELK